MSLRLGPTLLWLGILAALGYTALGIFHPDNVAERNAERAASVAKREADKLPRKYREADGCEVWTFKPGDRWLYFTRCGTDKTETINTWDECRSVASGKTTRQECTPHSMNITQEPK